MSLITIWRAYQHCPLGAQFRVLVRYLTCPFHALLKGIPPTGHILDVGCGDGLLFFLLSRESQCGTRECIGIDLAENKIANASCLQIGNAQFRQQDISQIASDSFHCVTIVDVLYLLPISQWSVFLSHSIRVLKKDGILIVKEVTDRPRWKYLFSYLQEVVSIHVTRMTKGHHPHFESIDTYRHSIEAAGGEVIRVERVDAMRPHAHVIFVARKP